MSSMELSSFELLRVLMLCSEAFLQDLLEQKLYLSDRGACLDQGPRDMARARSLLRGFSQRHGRLGVANRKQMGGWGLITDDLWLTGSKEFRCDFLFTSLDSNKGSFTFDFKKCSSVCFLEWFSVVFFCLLCLLVPGSWQVCKVVQFQTWWGESDRCPMPSRPKKRCCDIIYVVV